MQLHTQVKTSIIYNSMCGIEAAKKARKRQQKYHILYIMQCVKSISYTCSSIERQMCETKKEGQHYITS